VLAHLLQHTHAEVLLLSRDMRPDLRARAQAIGCARWVSMSSTAAQLVEAVESAYRGQNPAPRDVRACREVGLTPRELEVLTLITQGLSNDEIAAQLFLAVNTLKSHIRATYERIGVGTRAQAVAWAIQNGIAPAPPRRRRPSGHSTSGVAGGAPTGVVTP
jgi:DNA-binding NarL/FixJ family response regulator